MRSLLFCLEGCHSLKERRIYNNSVSRIGFRKLLFLLSLGSDDLYDGKAELLSEIKVTLVVGGNAHDRSGTVIREYIIGNPDGDKFFVKGIYGVASREYACFLPIAHTVYGRFC